MTEVAIRRETVLPGTRPGPPGTERCVGGATTEDEEASTGAGNPTASAGRPVPGSVDVHAGATEDEHWLLGSGRIIGTMIVGILLLSAKFFFLLSSGLAGRVSATFGSSLTVLVLVGFGELLTVMFFAALLIENFKI